MEHVQSRVTVHMAASLDGFIARPDGRVDWMDTSDRFEGGETLTPETIAAFVKTIDCYVMGARTYEQALEFEAKGLGWAYGDTPVFVLTHRVTAHTRATVELYSGDLGALLHDRLKPQYRNIWVVGGPTVCADCVRRGLADELRYSILPIVIGDGISSLRGLAEDVALHLIDSKAYANGIVELRYERAAK